jgi:hypothetical protein
VTTLKFEQLPAKISKAGIPALATVSVSGGAGTIAFLRFICGLLHSAFKHSF